MDGSDRILIVGGGLGGLTCALALARAGREVHVLEAAPELGEIGAGLQLAPNATRLLDELGVFDAVRETAVFPRELVYRDAWTGERIFSLDFGEPFLARYGHPYIVAHRGDLHRALLEASLEHSTVTVEPNKRVEGLEDNGDTVVARCADGTNYFGGALIGADGLHSFVRRWLIGDELVPTPCVAYRGPIPISEVHDPHDDQDNMVIWAGPDLHFVQYKLRGGEIYNQVGVFRSYRYGRVADYGSPAELDEHFSRCCELVQQGASLLKRGMRWPMADRDPIDNWTRNKITLLGDAAHPMLQYLAQGACQAIEDAVCLGRHVSQHDDLAKAFLSYQAERIPRTARVQRMARLVGDGFHLDGVGKTLRDHVLTSRGPCDYEPFDWLYQDGEAERPVLALAEQATVTPEVPTVIG